MQLEHIFKVNIGDWSEDGHCEWRPYVVCSSHRVEQVQIAFKSAAERLGFLTYNNGHPNFSICNDCQADFVTIEDVEILQKAGVETSDILIKEDDDPYYFFKDSPKDMVHLLMRIAQIDLDFDYDVDDLSIPNFNGFWSQTLNMQAGYGLMGQY